MLVAQKLEEEGLKLNDRKSIIGNVYYGFEFLGIKINPFCMRMGRKRIARLWYTSRHYRSVDEAFASCSSRKGMINRYKGRHLSIRWYKSLPEWIRKDLKMDSDAHFHLIKNDKVFIEENTYLSVV